MNIPEIYLVEPYNAYAPKGRKKHWHEVIEEQALMARILAEQQALQEAQSKTLPTNSPDIATPAVGNNAAGAGGNAVYGYWNANSEVVNFSATPLTGDGPLTVQFTNLTPTPQFDTYLWKFGDGTTSTDVNPTHVYQSGSSATGYSVQLTASHDRGVSSTAKAAYISASIPSVTANYTFTTSSNVAPFTASFVNTTVNTSQTPTTTYLWTITNGNNTTTATSTNLSLRIDSGSFTASLQATGSYGFMSSTSSQFVAAAPTLTDVFTVTTSSNSAPATASFAPNRNYNGIGTLQYKWTYGSGSITSSLASAPALIYKNAGSYTASLAVTESLYNITSYYTQSWRLA